MAEPPAHRRRLDDDAAAAAAAPRFRYERPPVVVEGTMIVPGAVLEAIQQSYREHGNFAHLPPKTLALALTMCGTVQVYTAAPHNPPIPGRLRQDPADERELVWQTNNPAGIPPYHHCGFAVRPVIAARADAVQAVIDYGEIEKMGWTRVAPRYLERHPAALGALAGVVYAWYPMPTGWRMIAIRRVLGGYRSILGQGITGVESLENMKALSVRFYVRTADFDPLGVPETLDTVPRFDMPLAVRAKRALASKEGTDWKTLNDRLRAAEAHPRTIGTPLYADLAATPNLAADLGAPSSVRFRT